MFTGQMECTKWIVRNQRTAVLVEVIERLDGDGAADPRGKRLARVACEVFDVEHLGSLLVVLRVDLEVPVVRNGQRQPRVVRRLDDDLHAHTAKSAI